MKGAIAAGHPLTAEAGARVLAEGGNAADACVAAACAAFVAEGPLTGPAGGGFVVAQSHGESTFLDCFFTAPSRLLGDLEEVVVDFADASTQVFHVGAARLPYRACLRASRSPTAAAAAGRGASSSSPRSTWPASASP